MIAAASKISRETVTRIADAANRAPSAENLQPWRFEADEESITFCLDMSRQLPSDLDQMLGLTAIGTSLENAILAASREGLGARIAFLTESISARSAQEVIPIARLEFDSDGRPDSLAEFIQARVTSRRMDPRQIVRDATRIELRESIHEFPAVELHWVDQDRLWEFAQLVGLGNRIRLEHEAYHAELYRSLRFLQADVERTKDGLDMRGLQLPSGAVNTMRVLANWQRMRLANVFGFSRFAGWQASQEVCGSGGVGFLTVPSAVLHQFVGGGRAFERLWLTATRLGLCFHPTASLPVFLTHARIGCRYLSPRHQRLVAHISDAFCRFFPETTGRTVQMAFRIGYGTLPPVRSLRRPLQAVAGMGD